MRMLKLSLLVVPLVLTGCWLTTGQVTIDFELDDTTVTSPTDIQAEQVDLNTIEDYNDHKEDLKGLSDIALLGSVTNNGATAIGVEAFVTPETTNYTTEAQVRANAVKVWGPFDVAAGQTVTIGWDESAQLITAAGEQLLIDEALGDGVFTVYLVGNAGTYSFEVNDGKLVLTLAGGI
jgi:hypothetical protein